MPTDVDCPSCAQKLRVPEDLLGKKVKCPACKEMFRATAGGLEAPAESAPADEDERPSRSNALTASRRDIEDDDEEDLPRRSKRGRKLRRKRFADYQPHRGTLILVFGILAIVVFPLIFGPIAWIMGNTDMKEIQAGRMDPEGESSTNIGRILGIIGTILGILGLLAVCLYFVFVFMIFGIIIGGAAGAKPH